MSKIAKLTERRLDYAVAMAKGLEGHLDDSNQWETGVEYYGKFGQAGSGYRTIVFTPTSDDVETLKIIKEHNISLKVGHDGIWIAYILDVNNNESFMCSGIDLNEAALRCFAISVLGEDIELPTDLKNDYMGVQLKETR